MRRAVLAFVALAAAFARAEPPAETVPGVREAYHRVQEGFYDLEENKTLDRRELDLGRDLFFDARLSGSGTMSCATCHRPDKAWADGLPRGIGRDGVVLSRNTPSLYGLRRSRPTDFFWDGRAPKLEDALLGAIQNPLEMNRDRRSLDAFLRADPGYAPRFRALYGADGADAGKAATAIATFVKYAIPFAQTPFDRFGRDPSALDAAAQRGLVLFVGKAACLKCHFGPFLSDDYYHNTGLRPTPGVVDPGRYRVVRNPDMWGAFKTPPLRNAVFTAPYMHDGSLATLEDVVDFYSRGGDVTTGVDPEIRPLALTPAEKADLVAFLRALSAAPPDYPAPTAGAKR